jgi:hypothetical protein
MFSLYATTEDDISSLYTWNRYLLVEQYMYISISMEF